MHQKFWYRRVSYLLQIYSWTNFGICTWRTSTRSYVHLVSVNMSLFVMTSAWAATDSGINFWHTAVEFQMPVLKEVASFLTISCDSSYRGHACAAIRCDPLKLCFSWHWTCKTLSLEALMDSSGRQRQKFVGSFPSCRHFCQKSWQQPSMYRTL